MIFRKRPVQPLYTEDPQGIPGGALNRGPGSLSNMTVSRNTTTGIAPSNLPDAPGLGDYAKIAANALGGFGGGPMGVVSTIGHAVMDPSSLTDTKQVNIPGIGNIATAPGPIGPMLDMTGFGALARAMGALNARNLTSIMHDDPNATAVSGPGYGGALSNGGWNGTLPGGLEASQRRAIVHDIALQHYANERARNSAPKGRDGNGRGGSPGDASRSERDPRGHQGGGRRVD